VNGSLFDQYKAALRRGHLAALAGNLDEALQSYRAAERLVPERALPVASQGTVLHRLDRWPEAAEAFERALQLAPDDEAALRARAAARDERGLRSGAAADYERLAFVLEVAGRASDAAEAARRASNLEPSAARAELVDRLAATAARRAGLLPDEAPTPQSRLGQVPDEEPGFVAPFEDAPASADPAEDEPDAPPVGAGSGFLLLDDPYRDEAMSGEEAQPGGGDDPADDDTADDAPPPRERYDAVSAALAARLAELGTQPAWVDMDESPIRAALGELGPEGQAWPPVDLPSPPPPPIEGPPPDPETLLAEADALIKAGDIHAARDLMLTAVMVHRAAGRLDAALEICLQLLSTAPGDAQVHLAIANLQLDRGWTALATEKIELLLRLTALTGDTQAEADVHGLASERLRDDAMSSASPR